MTMFTIPVGFYEDWSMTSFCILSSIGPRHVLCSKEDVWVSAIRNYRPNPSMEFECFAEK